VFLQLERSHAGYREIAGGILGSRNLYKLGSMSMPSTSKSADKNLACSPVPQAISRIVLAPGRSRAI
jgi:hypothetical protein